MPDGAPTASLTIRQLDPGLKDRLRARAAQHGRSMAEEARAILDAALPAADQQTGADLAEAIRRRFAPLGGVELELPPREPMRPPPRFE
jgi:plasmid stability protein